MPATPFKPRWTAYLALNVAFVALCFAGWAIGGSPSPRLAYVITMFALCSSWIIDVDALNGRHALLVLYQSFYFISFALQDTVQLFVGATSDASGTAFSETEAVILAGASMATLGYRAVTATDGRGTRRRERRDWSVGTSFTLGLILWVVGTLSIYRWGVYIVTDSTIEATQRGLAKLSPLVIDAYLLTGMLQPVGMLLVAYAWRSVRRPIVWPLIVFMVIAQFVLGFILNIKSMAMMGGILFTASFILLEGRIPKLWFAAGALFAVVGFPILVASRTEVHGERHIARATILENLGNVLHLAIAAEQREKRVGEHTQSLLERTSVRSAVQMIVEKTGETVAYQHGYTLTPLWAAFIPKTLWPDKPSVSTGQLVNREFHVSEYADTYISPSTVGELYWNFGWGGVILGMGVIGSLLGYIGTRFDMADCRTVTGLLVLMVTIKQLIVGLEGTFAPEYVVWMRSLGAIALLHLIFARRPVATAATGRSGQPVATSHGDVSPCVVTGTPTRFSNLLR